MTSTEAPNGINRTRKWAFAVLTGATLGTGLWLTTLFVDAIDRDHMDARLEAVDAATGETAWAIHLGVDGKVALGPQSIVALTGEGVVLVDSGGNEVWHYHNGRATGFDVTADAILVQVGQSDERSRVVAVGPRDGRELWHADSARLAVAGDEITALHVGNKTRLVATLDGGRLLERDTRARDVLIEGATVAFSHGAFIDVMTHGSPVRRLTVDGRAVDLLALSDHLVVAGFRRIDADSRDGKSIRAFEINTGRVAWQADPGYRTAFTDDDTLVLRAKRGVALLDVSTGEPAVRPAPGADDLDAVFSDDRIVVSRAKRLPSGDSVFHVYGTDLRRTAAERLFVTAGDDPTVIWSGKGSVAAPITGSLLAVRHHKTIDILSMSSGETLFSSTAVGASVGTADNRAIVTGTAGTWLVGGDLAPRLLAGVPAARGEVLAVGSDLVVIGRPGPVGRRGRILVVAHSLHDGRELWRLPRGRFLSTRLEGAAFDVVKRHEVIAVALSSGAVTVTQGEDPGAESQDDAAEAVLLGFDAALRRLLWSRELGESRSVRIVGDLVVLVEIEPRY